MKRRHARVGTPPSEMRMHWALRQYVCFTSRWNMPAVSIARMNLAFVRNCRSSTEIGME